MDPADLEGRVYGPHPWRIARDAVSDFVRLTGDDPERWSDFAPPGFAAAALFSVAPELLAELYDRSVVHGEQTFAWHAALAMEGSLEARGSVSRARERGGVHFVTFDIEVGDGADTVLTGRSLFLVAGQTIPAGEPQFVRPEPHHAYAGDPEPGELTASRADLVRYAAATRDWNPVHWDHEAGLAAGFPGVVVHGLLQAAWALRLVTDGSASPTPFASARFRFRNPLLPARPVGHTVEDGDHSVEVVLHDDDTEYLTAVIERNE